MSDLTAREEEALMDVALDGQIERHLGPEVHGNWVPGKDWWGGWKETLADQRARGWPDFHPETFCHRCGRPNVSSWWVDSAEWNTAVGELHAILCPPCFTADWEAATGLRVSWELRIDPSTDPR